MTATNTLPVANEIARQIGHRAFVMMGTRHKLGDANSLTFDVRGCREWNKVKISLDFATDLYTVEFFKCGRFHVVDHQRFHDVHGDAMHKLIEEQTGLFLSL